MYKMLVLDLDGTLLNSESHISPENIRALDFARDQGLRIVIATGRPPVGTLPYRISLGNHLDDPFITYNGALVQIPRTGENLIRHTIMVADYLTIADYAEKYSLLHYCFDEKSCLTASMHPVAIWEGEINQIPVRLVDFSQLDPATPLSKAMISGEPADLDRAEADLPVSLTERYVIVRSSPRLLEFLHPLASKGQAVAELAAMLGIQQDEVICVGDAGNDEDMIRYAGLGVAMGNATAAVKAVADFVTTSNDQNGVAEVVRRFVI